MIESLHVYWKDTFILSMMRYEQDTRGACVRNHPYQRCGLMIEFANILERHAYIMKLEEL